MIACKGILGRHTAEIENEHIVTMNINQSFAQRLLKIGDIEFTAASGPVKEVFLKNVKNPEALKELIRHYRPARGF